MKITSIAITCCAGMLGLALLCAAPTQGIAKSATKDFFQNVEDSTKKAASSTANYLDDSRITTQIKTLYLDETDLDSLDISVSTTDGIVTLTGLVNSQKQIGIAEQIARGVSGVKGVQNMLTIK